MPRWRSIWLVARREILERGRSRGFIFSVLFTTAIVVGSFLIPALLFSDNAAAKIGVVQPAPPALEVTIQAVASGADREIALLPYPDRAAAETALKDDKVEAVIAVPADLSAPGVVVYKESTDQILQSIVGTAVVSLRVNEVLTGSGVDQAALAAAQAPPKAIELDPQTDADRARFLVANIGAVLILVGIFSFGFTVLTGVVEEKQSRVVEVVLSTVRARDLLMGKVIGIGALGIVQLVVFVVAALGAASLTDTLVLPSTTPGAILLLAVWFILGYTLYSTALGFLGALASRMEEASNASTPVTMVAMVSYFVAIFAVVNDPHGTVAVIATFLPPSAPFVVPLRAAFDAIAPWEIGLSIVITLVGIWILFTIGARVYAGAVLQTAGRMKLRDAWRSAGE
jgi:ABC-2 type transport system permease protein